MFRFLAFATLALVAICLVVGASIALAVGDSAPAEDRMMKVIDTDQRATHISLAFANAAPGPQFDQPSNRLEI
jgi:hypothetical protein